MKKSLKSLYIRESQQARWWLPRALCVPGAQFTKYLTIYRTIIVRSTYDSDLKRAKSLLGMS